MSVFIEHKCEVCGSEELEKEKKRCYRCERMYDREKVAYVIYCDFFRFEKPGHTVTFWVADEKVQKAPRQFGQLAGKSAEELVEVMCAEGFEFEIWAAQVKAV
jgi:hypothetical protein